MNESMEKQFETLLKGYFEGHPPEPFVPGQTPVPVGWASYGPEEVQRVLRVLLSGWISSGPECREFEGAFARYIGVRHAVAVNSGSSANLVMMTALVESGRLPRGSEVIVPAATFATAVSPVLQAGLCPVFVDVEPRTYNISPQAIEQAIGPKTRAILVVHTLGLPAEMDAIMAIAGRHHLMVLEDCCEAHGTTYQDRRVGSFGSVATFSFYVAHNMTTGEGGMIVTSDPEMDAVLRSLREFGRLKQPASLPFSYRDGVLTDYDNRYVFERLGYNVRMTDTIAAFGIEQLKKLDTFNAQRIATANYYTDHLESFRDWIQTPTVPEGIVHTYYAYPVVVRQGAPYSRQQLARFLEERKIETRALFGGSLIDQPAFRRLGLRTIGELPVTRWLRDCCFFIGCHPGIGEAARAYVTQCFQEFFTKQPGWGEARTPQESGVKV